MEYHLYYSEGEDDDDDQFETVEQPPQISITDETDIPELGTVELTFSETPDNGSSSNNNKRKRRPCVTQRAREFRRAHHIVYLQCQLLSIRLIHGFCMREDILARCLSLVSPYVVRRIAQHLVPSTRDRIRREWATSDARYFLSSFQSLKISNQKNSDRSRDSFARFLETLTATQSWHQPMLLVCMLGSLKFNARLCAGILPPPLKLTVRESVQIEDALAGILSPTTTQEEKEEELCNSSPEYWCELYDQLSETWVPINAYTGAIEHPHQLLEKNFCYPYIIALDGQGNVSDVTQRYTQDYVNTVQRQRLESLTDDKDAQSRWDRWMSSSCCEQEEKELEQKTLQRTMPTRISDFAHSPYFVLQRNLSQNQVIYPAEPVVGIIRGEQVYLRENVCTVRSSMAWLREHGRQVKPNQVAIKKIKRGDNGLVELFGEWQTEVYRSQPVRDGKVPRNNYGQIDMFLPSMLPEGAVHVTEPGARKICQQMGIDAVDAVVGFDFKTKRKGPTPVTKGIVIPAESLDMVMDGLVRQQQLAIETRAIKHWRRLAKALLVKEEVDALFV